METNPSLGGGIDFLLRVIGFLCGFIPASTYDSDVDAVAKADNLIIFSAHGRVDFWLELVAIHELNCFRVEGVPTTRVLR